MTDHEMSSESHSPGPWKLYRVDDFRLEVRADGEPVAVAAAWPTKAQQEANARLIAAAPELLDCVNAVLNVVDGDGHPPSWDYIRAVAAKASGEEVEA